MTLNAFLIIFASVFLHAAWNFISRASRPSVAFFWLVEAFGGLFLIPFVFMAKIDWQALPAAFWWCFLGSSVFESLYSVGLSKTYKKTDISIAYPLMRALPVLLVALIKIDICGISRYDNCCSRLFYFAAAILEKF